MTRFDELVAKVRKTQEAYSKFGACDTEPDTHIQLAIDNAMSGVVVLPKNWELYTTSMDCRAAESALNAALLPLLEYVADAGKIQRQVVDFCWRIY